jgi:ribosome-associated translation inhibitor RaiA
MDRPLEVVFRNMKPSAELEADVRARAARLDLLNKHIIGCRVTVELENHTHKTGHIPKVHIEVEVPGKSITVNHKHEHEHGGDALTSIREAFDAAAKQLQEDAARKTLHLKHSEPATSPITE